MSPHSSKLKAVQEAEARTAKQHEKLLTLFQNVESIQPLVRLNENSELTAHATAKFLADSELLQRWLWSDLEPSEQEPMVKTKPVEVLRLDGEHLAGKTTVIAFINKILQDRFDWNSHTPAIFSHILKEKRDFPAETFLSFPVETFLMSQIMLQNWEHLGKMEENPEIASNGLIQGIEKLRERVKHFRRDFHPIYLVIDGLEDCETGIQTQVLNCLHDLLRMNESEKVDEERIAVIRILITNKGLDTTHPLLAGAETIQLSPLEEREDFKLFTNSKMSDLLSRYALDKPDTFGDGSSGLKLIARIKEHHSWVDKSCWEPSSKFFDNLMVYTNRRDVNEYLNSKEKEKENLEELRQESLEIRTPKRSHTGSGGQPESKKLGNG